MNIQDIHKELTFRTSRSSGSGGQHVNKVSTRVELLFDVVQSEALSEKEKAFILERLANRITQDGVLQLASDASRSQLQNKKAVIKKFDELIAEALQPRKKRAKTGAFKADERKRLKYKKQHAEKKANRKKVNIRRDIDLPSSMR